MWVHKMSQLFIRPAILLAFLFLNALAVSAQSIAKAELDRAINALEAKYNKISSLSADFTQVHVSRDQRERRENGRMLLKKPGKMKWITPRPKRSISSPTANGFRNTSLRKRPSRAARSKRPAICARRSPSCSGKATAERIQTH